MFFLAAVTLISVGQDKVGTRHFVDPKAKQPISKSIISIPKKSGKEPRLQVPPGFTIQKFASGLKHPRNLLVAENGDVFVLEADSVRIQLLRDGNGDGVAETKSLFCSGLRGPHGMAIFEGYFYVANTGSVVRYDYLPGMTKVAGKPEVVVPDLPAEKGYNMHWTRNLAFSPDGEWMFVTVGSATNDDIEPSPRGTILRFRPDGSDRKVWASGIRNPVGLTFRPGTNELWTSCIERDFYGNDTPPDFIAKVNEGDWFGWPYFYSGKNVDPKHKKVKPPRSDSRLAEAYVEAHSIPIGIHFYEGSLFPEEYQGDLFVAMRGSTNRVPRSGYKVVRFDVNDGVLNPKYEDFVVGWAPDRRKKEVHGRPTAVATDRFGALLIADEWGGCVWRVSRARK